MSVLALGCSNNEGPTGPSFPASQTGKTALALFPQSVNITAPNDGGTCVSRIQFLATGGEPPYKFFTAFSAGPGSGLGKSTIDANGLYTAELSAGATLAPDTVVVIDSVGAQATTKDITIKCV